MMRQLLDAQRLEHDQARRQLQRLPRDCVGLDLVVEVRPRQGDDNGATGAGAPESFHRVKAAAGVQGDEQIAGFASVLQADGHPMP
jgi:hypothetical protein